MSGTSFDKMVEAHTSLMSAEYMMLWLPSNGRKFKSFYLAATKEVIEKSGAGKVDEKKSAPYRVLQNWFPGNSQQPSPPPLHLFLSLRKDLPECESLTKPWQKVTMISYLQMSLIAIPCVNIRSCSQGVESTWFHYTKSMHSGLHLCEVTFHLPPSMF